MKKYLSLSALLLASLAPAFGQAPPPYYSPAQLNQLVARIALYPDPLLAQVLAAATYPGDIVEAARWSDEHHYLTGRALADAIQSDQLPWDPSVQSLLPFPSVLDTMASDMNWTSDLGNAFLANQQAVMDAVQNERRQARDFGYLRSTPQIVVGGGPYITIIPTNPAYIPVPYYDPAIVYIRPRPGFVIGGAIRFGYGVTIGGFFQPWGWGVTRFDWGSHVVIVNNAPWGRTWVNRGTYVHPYAVRRAAVAGPRPAERHQVETRSPRERAAPRQGQKRVEDHKAEKKDERR